MAEDISEEVRRQQQQRTFLRERYLRMLGGLHGEQARVTLYHQTVVHCRFGVSDVDFERLQVSQLSTPMGVLPQAVLRTSDIIAVHVDDLGLKPKS
ncbi:gem-associated protein 7-like [Babylonia areolata]|uniref:gem-associated protein 7-like n=1 Tax=Babylonia areolata TaxID=304850 RepID=UPI003FD08611